MTSTENSRPDVAAFRLMQEGRLEEALAFAKLAVAGQRTCVPAHGMLATILLNLGRITDAEFAVSEALLCEPGAPNAYDALAHISMLLGQHERSNELYRRIVQMAPREARFWYNFASSERSFGRLVEAEAACDRAIALDPAQYGSYLLRSELRVQSAAANHIAELQSVLARPGLDKRAHVPLGYALAKELDDLRRYDEAFSWLHQAASIHRAHLAYDVAIDERKLQRISQVFTPQLVCKTAEAVDSSRYIFIVGLPRSGTTLLEHILTGLPGVRSNGETDKFSRALLTAAPSDAGDIFARAAAADPRQVGTLYASLADHGPSDGKIIEKLPMNYLYLGAIHRALPHAKLILVNRCPLDSCFAMYRTLFGSAYPFTYDFADLARYYVAYNRLLAHWRSALARQLCEVNYEDLVGSPKKVGASVASYCELPWDPHAIEIERNTAVSLTASAAQIRRSIYGSSAGRWRNYRPHLSPLIDGLRRYDVALPDDA